MPPRVDGVRGGPSLVDREPRIGPRRVPGGLRAPHVARLARGHDVDDSHAIETLRVLVEPGEDRLVGRRRDQPRREDLRVDDRSEEHTSELQSLAYLVCRLLLEKKNRV